MPGNWKSGFGGADSIRHAAASAPLQTLLRPNHPHCPEPRPPSPQPLASPYDQDGDRSVGLSVVPKSAAASAADEILRAPVSFNAFFAFVHHSGVSQ